MPLIKSISGFRGTIGGPAGENLSPQDIFKFTTAYSSSLKKDYPQYKIKIVVGRDGRVSGEMLKDLVIGTLLSQGVDVVDLGLATTPSVELAVGWHQAQGGIIITASHNPAGWNALKFLNSQGEFLSAQQGKNILKLAKKKIPESVLEKDLGNYSLDQMIAVRHISEVLKLKAVKKKLIIKRKFKIVVDGINSVGGLVIPQLLKALGVKDIIEINCVPNGLFAHQPEPLDKNLKEIKKLVVSERADLGIVVDPDVDRLAFIDEQGKMFGEEYTLVAVADYILKNYQQSVYKKATVSNLSSSRALADISKKQEADYYASAVGEVNVVQKMKEKLAIIGGEGNGGIIYPQFHYGRDALVGVALFLSSLAFTQKSVSKFKEQFPLYFMVKDRINLIPGLNLKKLLNQIKQDYLSAQISTVDGLKIDWTDSWVHLRASNTEAIIRIYSEAHKLSLAQARVSEIKKKILAYIK